MQLDRSYLQILEVLAQNCRISYAELGRALKLSKDTVVNRIRRLEEAQVISQYQLFIDARKLGFTRFHLLVQLQVNSRLEEYISRVCNHPSVMWVNSFVGLYDFQVIVDAVDGFQLNQIKEELFSFCDNKVRNFIVLTHLADLEFTQLNPILNFKTAFNKQSDQSFSAELTTRRFPVDQNFDRVSVNRLDLDVLKLLADNPRASLIALSEEIGCERQTIRRRILRLINDGVILNFGAIPNISILGFFTYYILVRLDQNLTLEEMKRPFLELNNIFYAGRMIGEYDMIVYLNARNPQELNKSIHSFRSKLRGRILGYDLMIQDKVFYWRQFTNGIYRILRERVSG